MDNIVYLPVLPIMSAFLAVYALSIPVIAGLRYLYSVFA